MQTKRCSSCRRTKNFDEFYVETNATAWHKRSGYCKSCAKKRAIIWHAKIKKLPKPVLKELECARCKSVLPVSMFGKNIGTKTGRSGYCKSCVFDWRKSATHTSTWWYRRCFGKNKALRMHGVTPQEIKQLFEQSPFCAYCGVDLRKNMNSIHVDHKTPKIRGGRDAISNLAISCRDCNRMKWTMTEFEFRAFLKEYVKRFTLVSASVYSLSEYVNKKEAQA